MTLRTVAALTLSSLLGSSCAATYLAEYPSGIWPERVPQGDCAGISRRYVDLTEDVWPTGPMRGSKAVARGSLTQLLTSVSPVSRPIDWPAIEGVKISIPEAQATILGFESQVINLREWRCASGVLAGSAERESGGEQTFNGRVEIRIELQLASDGTLIVHQLQKFSDLSMRPGVHERWYRFRAAGEPR